jgi:hypothetical protein
MGLDFGDSWMHLIELINDFIEVIARYLIIEVFKN